MCSTKLSTGKQGCGHIEYLILAIYTGYTTRMSVNSMGAKEKATFELALSLIKWEPLCRLDSCNEKYEYYQAVIDKPIEICFPSKV